MLEAKNVEGSVMFRARVFLDVNGCLNFSKNESEVPVGGIDVTELLLANHRIRELWYRENVACKVFNHFPQGSELDNFGSFHRLGTIVHLMENCVREVYPYTVRWPERKHWDFAELDGEVWYYLFPEIENDPYSAEMKQIFERLATLHEEMEYFYYNEANL